MQTLYNIYCDESCHLENDGNDIMVLGAMSCPNHLKKQVYQDIRNIKIKHNLSSWFEIKWTKVSESKIDLYLDLINYFFENTDLSFRTIVATGKTKLDHHQYNQGDHNIWYYKMYFQLLDAMIYPIDEYAIYIDIKDTQGGPKIKKLREVLCNNIYDYNMEVIKDIKQINSHESEVMQLTDLLIGAISFFHRNLHKLPDANKGKVRLINEIRKKHKIDFSKSTPKHQEKLNIFIWSPRGCR